MTAAGSARPVPELSVADLDHADSLGLLIRQTRVLELIAAGAPLAEMLTAVTVALEELIPGSRCSILLLDAEGATLHHGAAPSLPAGYSAAIDGLVIADDARSCGAAAYLGERVVAEDIAVDRRWDRFRHLALPRGLQACWSSPILGRTGSPVGTFAVYHPHPHLPSVREQRLVDRFTHLASVAIEHSGLFGALAESEDRFRRTFEANAVGMALTDLDGRFTRVNRALAEMVGRTEPDLLAADLAAVLEPAAVERSRTALRPLRDGARDSVVFETRLRRPDGETVLAAATASVVRGVHGDPVHLSLNLLDVTQRRAAEAERRARREAEVARSAAEAASRAKSEFLSAVSHELRTPLQAITGFTELLGTLDLNPERRRDALRHIAGAASHILALVDDVLDIAKIEARALPLQIADVELAGLVGEVLDLLAPLAVQRGVTLDRGALDGVVRADRRRLRQIVINLVTNGVRYHHGDGWVRVEAVPVPGTGELAVRVVDNGPGIPSALLGRLFVPFDRLGRETARAGAEPEPGQGAGLGLMLARGLTEAMAGRLEVRSVEGAGTTVEVVLPGAYVISTAARRDRV